MTAKFFGTLTHEHDGKTLTLVMDMNAVCHFDAATGLNFFDVVASWEKTGGMPPASHLRAIIHAAMQEHHQDMTVQDAGRIISGDLGVFERLMSAAMDGMAAETGKKGKAAA